MVNANAMDIKYSNNDMCSNSNASDKNGTYITSAVHTKDITIAYHKYLF